VRPADIVPVIALLAAVTLVACGSRPRPAKPAADASVEVTLAVDSNKETNDGRPLHAVVRVVDKETYAADSYASIADLVSQQDPSVLATFVVFPGHRARAAVQVSAKTPIAVYFLFTSPGKPWRKLIDAPLPKRVELRLARASIHDDD
jgi:hypothetical protein